MRKRGQLILNHLNLPLSVRARVELILDEMHRRNGEYLAMHARLVDGHKAIFDIVADEAVKGTPLTLDEMRDVVYSAVAAYAYDDLEEGAHQFIEMMAFKSSWKEKMALIELAVKERQTKQ